MVEPRADGRREAGFLPVPLEPHGALGRTRPPLRSPTAGRSARCSTATACARPVTTSPRTTWSSWRPRPACSTFRPENVLTKGRLQPGRMFLVDTEQGRIVDDEEIKRSIASERPYRQWLERAPGPSRPDPGCARSSGTRPRHAAAAADRLRIHVRGRAHHHHARWPATASKPWAPWAPTLRWRRCPPSRGCCSTTSSSCSRRSPIRPLTASGKKSSRPPTCGWARKATCCSRNPRTAVGSNCGAPILTNEQFAKVRRLDLPGIKAGVVSTLFRVARGEKGLVSAMNDIFASTRRLVEIEGINVLILSDRGVNRELAPIPALLAVSGLHHFLIREGLRTRVSLVLETGEAREVHHFSLIIGYGCSAINPYLAFETIDGMIRDGLLPGIDHKTACKNFVKAATKGVVKVMSKMGISAIESYHGAQVFEAVGLRQDVIDEYFTWTAIAGRRHRHRRGRQGNPDAPSRGVPAAPGGRSRAARRRPVSMARRRRIPPVQSGVDSPPAEGGAHRQLRHLQVLRPDHRRPVEEQVHPARAAGFRQRHADSDRRGGIGREHHEALQDRRDVLRLHQQGGPRDPGDRHEPDRRQVATPAKAARIRSATSRCRTATRRTRPSSRLRRAASA